MVTSRLTVDAERRDNAGTQFAYRNYQAALAAHRLLLRSAPHLTAEGCRERFALRLFLARHELLRLLHLGLAAIRSLGEAVRLESRLVQLPP
jgi:hypothetical protein